MRRTRGWFLACLVLSSAIFADEFRVTGVFGVDGGALMALIETGDGADRVIRAGDDLVGMRVLAVTADGIRLVRDGSEEFVPLSGGDAYLRDGRLAQALPPTALVNRLRDSQVLRAQGGVQGIEDLERLSEDDVSVLRVNDKPVLSLDDAVGTIEETLAKGEPARLEVGGETSTPVLYLTPRQTEADPLPVPPSRVDD